MPEPINLALAFGLPPARAVEYFRAKGYNLQLTRGWEDLWQEAHARAFTVAGVTRMDVLQDIHAALQSAIKGEITQRDFIKNLEPTLRAKGWWGPQVQVDEQTMEARLARTGSPWRLKTIYRTNLQTAYMTGRYSQMIENVAFRPFWQYVAVMDERTRPAHAVMNGLVFRYDDPFWDHFYPPNGFNCRCTVRALSQRDIDERGLMVRESGEDLRERWKVDPSTGLTEQVADYQGAGMQRAGTTDLGWNYNPGKAWGTWDPAGALPDGLPGEHAGTVARMIDGQSKWSDFGLPDIRKLPASALLAAPQLLSEGKSVAEALGILTRAVGITVDQPTVIVTTPIERVALRSELLLHVVDDRAARRERYSNFLLPALTDPLEIWMTAYDNGELRRRYVAAFEGSRNMAIIVRENNDGSFIWTVMPRDDRRLNDFRVGIPIYPKLKGEM